MKTIPAIEDAQLIIDEILYQQTQDNPDAHLRMLDGAEKYGKSWAEVDLKTDALEECYDLLNYGILTFVRQAKADVEQGASLELWESYSLFRDKVKELIAYIESFFPEFEGPTSAEWVESFSNGSTV